MKRDEKYYAKHHIFTYGLEMKRLPLKTANKLNEEFNLNTKEAHFSSDGTWYELIKEFPATLFDTYGYIIIESSHHLRCIGNVTKYINIPKGIHKRSEYKKFPFIPTSIEDYEQELKNCEIKKQLKDQEVKKESDKTASLKLIMLKSLAGKSSLIKC